jgi:cytochrome bd ubiquinol oxidase subunit II
VLAAAAGTTTLVLLYRRMYSIARAFAGAAVGAVVAGWAVGQYPWILVDQLTITQAATADATLGTLGVVEALSVATALPLFGYLLRLTPTDKSDRR